jgi:hypothetical protein
MSPKDEDFIRFYRDAVIAGHNEPAAETMRHFNLSRDYIVRLLNETITGCEGQDMIPAAQVHGQFALHDIVLSPQEIFFQRIAVGRHGRIADIRIL